MADLVYPGGAGITAVVDTDLEADDMTFIGSSIAGAAQQTDYSDIKTAIKTAIMADPGAIGSGTTPATEINTNLFYLYPSGEEGFLMLVYETANSGALSGATGTITLNLGASSKILACQLRVDVAVADSAGNDTWSAAYSGGSTQAIVSGAAAAKNTKVNKFFDVNAVTDITASTTNITLTPNGGNFTAGQVTAVVWYWYLVSLKNV